MGRFNVWMTEDKIDPKWFIKYFVSRDAQVQCFMGLFMLPLFYFCNFFFLFFVRDGCFVFIWGFFGFGCRVF